MLCFAIPPGPAVIKLFSCSSQLSKKIVLLIILKLLTITVNSFLLNIAEYDNFSVYIYACLLAEKISCSAELNTVMICYSSHGASHVFVFVSVVLLYLEYSSM